MFSDRATFACAHLFLSLSHSCVTLSLSRTCPKSAFLATARADIAGHSRNFRLGHPRMPVLSNRATLLSARISLFVSHTRASLCLSLGTGRNPAALPRPEPMSLNTAATPVPSNFRFSAQSGNSLASFLPLSIHGFLPRTLLATKRTVAPPILHRKLQMRLSVF